MSQKITDLIKDLGFVFFAIALPLFFLINDASLHVTCELQNDETYTCDVRDTLLGWEISNTHVEKVTGSMGEGNCQDTSKNKGCSYTPFLQISTGEKVRLGKFFNAVPKTGKALVETLDGTISNKTPVIDHTVTQPVFFSLALLSCLTPLSILRMFIRLFPRSDKPRMRTLISWKSKED